MSNDRAKRMTDQGLEEARVSFDLGSEPTKKEVEDAEELTKDLPNETTR